MKKETISVRIPESLKRKMDEAKEKEGKNWARIIEHCIMKELGIPIVTMEKLEELVKSALASESKIKRWMLYWYANGFSHGETLSKIMNEHVSAMANTEEDFKEAKRFLLEMERAGITETYIYVDEMSMRLSDILRDILEQEKITEKIKKDIEEKIKNDNEIFEMSRILYLYVSDYLDYATVNYLMDIFYGEKKGKKVLKKLIGGGVLMHQGYSSSRKHTYDSYKITPESESVLKEIFKHNKKEINKDYIEQIVNQYPLSRDILLWVGGKDGLKPRYENYSSRWREDEDVETFKILMENPLFSKTIKELIDKEIIKVKRDHEVSSYYSIEILEPAKDAFQEWWIEETS